MGRCRMIFHAETRKRRLGIIKFVKRDSEDVTLVVGGLDVFQVVIGIEAADSGPRSICNLPYMWSVDKKRKYNQ